MSKDYTKRLLKNITTYIKRLDSCKDMRVTGRLVRIVGLKLEAVGLHCPLGTKCMINGGSHFLEAEVVGFNREVTYLMTSEETQGLMPDAEVIPNDGLSRVAVGHCLLGRVLDANGDPLDAYGSLQAEQYYPLNSDAINPLARNMIEKPLDVGVRAINTLLTIGRGQRMGLLASSGMGKSVLLGMMTKFTTADVIVVGLIGERGREVKEFIEHILGPEGLKRAVVIAVPADNAPLMRMKGALTATSIAEYFRDQGSQVLLLIDSLTRFAHAQREVSLAIGEPPATRGFPPSVFSKLSHLIERTGMAAKGNGSITAFYTILTEGDMIHDPVAESARAILDGHIILSKELADSGHYPAIDIEASISRVMNSISSVEHQQKAIQIKTLYAKFRQNQDLINIGAYTPGADPQLDYAIKMIPRINRFLKQEANSAVNYDHSLAELFSILPTENAHDNVTSINKVHADKVNVS